jgi:hypothetical protein
LTIPENGIKENHTIVVKRVTQDEVQNDLQKLNEDKEENKDKEELM